MTPPEATHPQVSRKARAAHIRHRAFLLAAALWLGVQLLTSDRQSRPIALWTTLHEDAETNVSEVVRVLELSNRERVLAALKLAPPVLHAIEAGLPQDGHLVIYSPLEGERAEAELGFLSSRLAVYLYPRRARAARGKDDVADLLSGEETAKLLVLDLSVTDTPTAPFGAPLELATPEPWPRLWRWREDGP